MLQSPSRWKHYDLLIPQSQILNDIFSVHVASRELFGVTRARKKLLSPCLRSSPSPRSRKFVSTLSIGPHTSRVLFFYSCAKNSSNLVEYHMHKNPTIDCCWTCQAASMKLSNLLHAPTVSLNFPQTTSCS